MVSHVYQLNPFRSSVKVADPLLRTLPLRITAVYLSRMRGRDACPQRKPLTKILWSGLGGFVGIFAVTWFARSVESFGGAGIFLIGSFGASAVLVYGFPMGELSQPRNLVGGHLLSAVVGVTVARYTPQALGTIAPALAVGFAIMVMHATRTLHPPGGATALIAIIGPPRVVQLGYAYVWAPVLMGTLVLLAVALLVNNLSANPRRHYPNYWY